MSNVLRLLFGVVLIGGGWVIYRSTDTAKAPSSGAVGSGDELSETPNLERALVTVRFEVTTLDPELEENYSAGGWDFSGAGARQAVPDSLGSRFWIYVDDRLAGDLSSLHGRLQVPRGIHTISVVYGGSIRSRGRGGDWHRGFFTPFVAEVFGPLNFEHEDSQDLTLDLVATVVPGHEVGASMSVILLHTSFATESKGTTYPGDKPFVGPVAPEYYPRAGHTRLLEEVLKRQQAVAPTWRIERTLEWLRPLEDAARRYPSAPRRRPSFNVPEVRITHPAGTWNRVDRGERQRIPAGAFEVVSRTRRDWCSAQIGHVRSWIEHDLSWIVGTYMVLRNKGLEDIPPEVKARIERAELLFKQTLTELDHLFEDMEIAMRKVEGNDR